jgi:HEAT repeat protein
MELVQDPNPQLRVNALEALQLTPGRLAAFIPNALKDANPAVRSTAAMMIGKARLRDLAPATRPLLNDPSPFARASAIFALQRAQSDIDISPLAGILLSDPSPRVRAHVAYLLGEMADPSALGLLHEAAKAGIPRASGSEIKLMQLQIAEALAKLGEEDQVATIRAALYPARPEDLEVTALAAQILGQLRDRGSETELVYLTARTDRNGHKLPAEVRLACAAALARMGKTQGTFLADEYASNPLPALRAQSAYVYGEIGRAENLPKLEHLLSDPEGIVQVAAAAAILRMTAAPGEGGAP